MFNTCSPDFDNKIELEVKLLLLFTQKLEGSKLRESVSGNDFVEEILRKEKLLDEKQNLFTSAIWIILLDTFIAMLAGTAIFTIVFAMGADPSAGAGLIFVVLPTIFPQIGGGAVWGTLFFFILFMAALTSAISILEVITAYF